MFLQYHVGRDKKKTREKETTDQSDWIDVSKFSFIFHFSLFFLLIFVLSGGGGDVFVPNNITKK